VSDDNSDKSDGTRPAKSLARTRARAQEDLPRLLRTDVLERLAATEELYAGGRTYRQVVRELRRQGLSQRRAQRYAAAVPKLWSVEAGHRDREDRRAWVRAQAEAGIQRAIGRTRSWVNKHGDIGEHPDPDERAVGVYLELLCRLDGLLDQPGVPDADRWGQGEVLRHLHLHYYGVEPPARDVIDAKGEEPAKLAGGES